jgi:carbon storage regulator CsrA
MLVLSRRPNEKLWFPSIKAAVQVVSIKPGVVRLGIDAPPEVQVLREELLAGAVLKPTPVELSIARLRDLNHLVRNRLNAARIGLALLRRQMKAGKTTDAEDTLEKVDTEFQILRQHMEQTTRSLVQETSQAVRRKALLVEDDQNERELLAGFLRMAGLDVATAGDGTDALDYLRTDRPDVVLLDMVLPRCDGPTTVREIRQDPGLRDLKIFAVTGHDPDRFGLQNPETGVDRWFHKPLNPEHLLRDIQLELGSSG